MQRYAAASGIPDALLSCHRYDEILPPGAIQSCHLNENALDCQIQRTAAVLRSEQQAVRCGLPVIRPEPRNLESLVSALFGERLGDLAQLRMSRHCPDFTRQALPEMPFYRPLAEDTDRPERLNE